MAPPRRGGGGSSVERMSTSANVLFSDNQSLLGDIRRALGVIKGVAVDLEKDAKTDKVKQMEEAFLELLATYDDYVRFNEAIQAVGDSYQPQDEPTNFRKLLEDVVAKRKAESPTVPQSNLLYRQFMEAVWKVNHEGQPMPGEEQEDIIVTGTQNNILNTNCPLTGKPVIELESPVRCTDCKHIYEKVAIMEFIRRAQGQTRCPIAGCPKILQASRVVCDPLLLIEIEEMRSTQKETMQNNVIEDFTDLNEDVDNDE